jgi:hypothetical protein
MNGQGLRFVEHTLGTILRAVLAIFFSFPVAGAIAAIVVEAIGALVSQRFPAPPLTHVLAIAFALVVGYATALTYAVIESIVGATRVAKFLEQDVMHEGSLLEKGFKQLERTVVGR